MEAPAGRVDVINGIIVWNIDISDFKLFISLTVYKYHYLVKLFFVLSTETV